jgi:hypothetical protein
VFGSSFLAGDGFKNSLRNGLTAGALSFGVAGVTQAGWFFRALQGRPGFEAAYAKEGFLGTVKQTAQNYFGSPVDTAKQMYGTETAPGASDAAVIKTAQDYVTHTCQAGTDLRGDCFQRLGTGPRSLVPRRITC